MRFPSGYMICRGPKKHQAVQWCVVKENQTQKKLPELPEESDEPENSSQKNREKSGKGELGGELEVPKLPDSKGEGSPRELNSLPSRVAFNLNIDGGGNKLPQTPNSPPKPKMFKILKWLSNELAEHRGGIPLSAMVAKVDDPVELNEYLVGMSRDGYITLGKGLVDLADKGWQFLQQEEVDE